MPAVLTSTFRIQNTINFYDGFYSSVTPSVLYIAFSRTEEWDIDSNGKTESQQGFIVPQPSAIDGHESFRTDFLGAVKLNSNNVCPVIPRTNWEAGVTYNRHDVVITDEFNVYLVTNDISTSTKPTHISASTVNNFQFLYKISDPLIIQNFVTNEWIPVYRNGNVGNLGTPNSSSMLLTNCVTLMFSRGITENELPVTDVDDFRQIGLWTNPRDTSDNQVTSNSIVKSDIDISKGIILYIDNRLPIYRTSGQTEDFKILIGF